MQHTNNPSWPDQLPLTGDVKLAYAFSLLIGLLMTVASVVGLLNPDQVYPTQDLRQSLMPTDVVNLVVGLPILLGAMALTWRGKLIGLLFWPGALFYVFYHYVAYMFSTPLSWQFLVYIVLMVASIYTMAGLLASIEGKAVQAQLARHVAERIIGGALVGLGLLFVVLVLGRVVPAIIGTSTLSRPDLATSVSDFFIVPAFVIGGVHLWQRKTFGYVVGLGLLFQLSMLFVGLILLMLLQPLLVNVSYPPTDILVVAFMSLLALIPFGLFVRGLLKMGA